MDLIPELTLPFFNRRQLDNDVGVVTQLKISTQCDSVVTLTIRGLCKSGPFSFNHITSNNSSIATDTFEVPDIPIVVSVIDKDGVLAQGQCFARLNLRVNGDDLVELCSGWVYTQKGLSYPTQQQQDLRPNGGFLTTVQSADPAANAEISHTVPTGQVWKIYAMFVSFVTDGNAANRRPQVTIDDGTNVFMRLGGNDNLTASTTWLLSFHHRGGSSDSSVNALAYFHLPLNVVVKAGYRIKTVTQNLQVGDNYGAMTFLIDRYFTPA